MHQDVTLDISIGVDGTPLVADPTDTVQAIKEEKDERLNPKQELFCQLYATDREFFGNGVQTYIEVYEPDQSKPNWYKTACVCASVMLSNAKIYNRINELLQDQGLNEAFADKQLLFLMQQQADFTNKLGALKEFNKLKQRIIDRADVTTKGKPLEFTVISYKDFKKE